MHKEKTVEDYTEELEHLDAAGELNDDEPEFYGTVLNLPAWEKYQQITKPLVALQKTCESVLKARCLNEPYPAEEFASTTVTLPLVSMLEGEAKAVIADAIQHCDRFFASAFGNQVRLTFLVNHIWADGRGE
jgi:hypothetical protein